MIDMEVCESAFAYYPRLAKVKAYVESNLGEEIRLAQLAEVAGLEEKYFSAYFRTKTGMRAMSWVSAVRIQRSKKLMWARDDSITNIAFAVGFQDIRSFQRTFKKSTGVTAREFKRKIKSKLPSAY